MNQDVINEHYHGAPADPATERARERIHWICAQANGRDILDIGCSQGIVCLILGREGFHCAGIDIESASIAVAQEALAKEDEIVRQRVSLQVADAVQLPFPDESFDTVVLGEILEHLVHPARVLAQARRVLRPGARLVVTVPYGLNAHPDHKRTFYPISLLELLQPLFRTTTIGASGNYILYTGVKEPAYDLGTVSKETLFEQYLPLEKALQERCLAKERTLLETATRLHAQIKNLGTQSAQQASKITQLEETLAARDKQACERETELEQARASIVELRAQTERGRAESLAQAAQVQELLEEAAAKDSRLRDSQTGLERAETLISKLQERAVRAESESIMQASRVIELREMLAAKEDRIQQLEGAGEQRWASITELTQRVIHAEAESIAQANKVSDLQETIAAKNSHIGHLEGNLDQLRAAIASQSERVIRVEADSIAQASRVRELEGAIVARDNQVHGLEKSIEQEREAAAAFRKSLMEAESAQARLNAEAASARSALAAMEQRLADAQQQNTQLKEDLAAKSTAFQRQLSQIEALHAASLRDREKRQEDLQSRRDADWRRKWANQRVREVARLALPPEARVLVITKGDDDLLNLEGRHGSHFPQTADGVYAGYHPAGSAEAIQHLETLRTKGAEFLLIPASSFWWLDYYADFRQHLEAHYRLLVYGEESCVIFALAPARSKVAAGLKLAFEGGHNGHGQLSDPKPPKKDLLPEPAQPSPPTGSAGAPAGSKNAPPPPQLDLDRARLAARAVSSRPGILPSNLQVGCVLDEFTEACFRPEWTAVMFRPDNWKATFERTPFNLLFVESAWKGNQGSWQYKIASVPKGHELEDLVFHCRAKGVPTAFWNKEDPVHFERFIKAASLFDYVFTTDSDCIPRYQEYLQHKRVFALPFAAQPRIHNPVLETERLHNVCFAGAYYGLSHDERRKDMDVILKPSLEYGLHIFDRQHGLVGTSAEQYRYPDIYQSAIKGYLPYDQMVQAYKRYRVFLNVNSVKHSPTMFSRRIFELLASGTPVISAYAKGIENLIGTDIVLFSETEQQTKQHLERLLANEQEWARLSARGIRVVFDRHSYAHRCHELCSQIDPAFSLRQPPTITVIAKVGKVAELERLTTTLSAQTHRHFNVALFLEKSLKEAQAAPLINALKDIKVQIFPGTASALETCIDLDTGDYCWFFNLNDYYGPNFLKDCDLAVTYSNAEFIGKHTHFALAKDPASLEPSSQGYEFRFVNSVAPGSLLAKKGSLSKQDWETALGQRTLSVGKQRALSIDRFNYVRNAFAPNKDRGTTIDSLLKSVEV